MFTELSLAVSTLWGHDISYQSTPTGILLQAAELDGNVTGSRKGWVLKGTSAERQMPYNLGGDRQLPL